MKIDLKKIKIEDITKKDMLIISSVVFSLVLILGIITFSPEDEWVCEDGMWVAHGKPENPKPIVECSKRNRNAVADETYCEKDEDCACGGHISKNNCFLGNKRFVDAFKKCSKMCPEDMKIKCVKNKCQQENN